MRYESTQQPSITALIAVVTLLLVVPVAASASGDGYDTGYGFVRTLEGTANVVQAESNTSAALSINYPILPGDRVSVEYRSRVEMRLPDRTLLRLGSAGDLYLNRLGAAPETNDTMTQIELARGDLQISVQRDFLAQEYPRIDTDNASIYIHSAGEYRVSNNGRGETRTVVRSGFAEVLTEAGSSVVRAGEELVVEGASWPRVWLQAAGPRDAMELWADQLDGVVRRAAVPYVDEGIRYEAASLNQNGQWVSVSGRNVWRPYVETSWRPYYSGRWVHTPIGLTWVSAESWGWVTHHYGSWDHVPRYGWVWYPGNRYSPAWVYWHWSSDYVGWVPHGYYSRHYRNLGGYYGSGLRFGIYGWAGGSWDHYLNWTFCSTSSFRNHRSSHHFRTGDHMRRVSRHSVVPRGIVTTHTRGLSKSDFDRPQEVVEHLSGARTAHLRGSTTRELPDVTSFVERRAVLPEEVKRRVVSDGAGDPWDRAARRSDPLSNGVGSVSRRVPENRTERETSQIGTGTMRNIPGRTTSEGVQRRGATPPAASGNSGVGVPGAQAVRKAEPYRITRPEDMLKPGGRDSRTESWRGVQRMSGETSRTRKSGTAAPAPRAYGDARNITPRAPVARSANPLPPRVQGGRTSSISPPRATAPPPARRVLDGIRSGPPQAGRSASPGVIQRRPQSVPSPPSSSGVGARPPARSTGSPSAVRPSAPRAPAPKAGNSSQGSSGGKSKPAPQARSTRKPGRR